MGIVAIQPARLLMTLIIVGLIAVMQITVLCYVKFF